MPRKLIMADLFAGCGGITEGFKAAGFRPAVAVEFDRWAAASYAANHGDHVLVCPIEEVSVRRSGESLIWTGTGANGERRNITTPEIDVLVGGPPCQGFSPLGRMTDWDKEDPRNKLWRHYARILRCVRPKVFVIENVPELLRSPEFEELVRVVTAPGLGYRLAADVLNASHYGVPQRRRRAIIVGSRVGAASLPPAVLERLTVRDAIADLPMVPHNVNLHVGRNPTAKSIERYKAVPPGGNRFDLMKKRPDITPNCWMNKPSGSTDVFGRMEWDKPAPTIRTEFFKPEKGRYLHPTAHRPITLREAARLQTFPDSFRFVGSNVQVAKQIGNAVPVVLAARIADYIKNVVITGKASEGIKAIRAQQRLRLTG